MSVTIKQLLFGKPLPSSRAHHERLDKLRGLAVFASDTISSNAYATEAIMTTLVILGASALRLTLPIALTIALLVLLVIFSYNQTIRHYPMGGGAYMVAQDNLGTIPSLVAGAALLTDYVLTVAVSVSAGVKAITSAFPTVAFVHEHRVFLAIVIVTLITWMNLRGVRESGTIFAFPTYAFVAGVLLVVGIGLIRYAGLFGVSPLEIRPETVVPTHEVTSLAFVWLVLRAFAAGCTALTGIEAISNGVQAFREPAARNAAITMRAMGIIAMSLFIGISFLATHIHIVPNETESVLSQMTRAIVGDGPIYIWVQTFTMLILILAANTAYQDFPRLAAFLAQDRYLPRWMTHIGDRLVYSMGIGVLAVLASILIALFEADEIALLPLYAIGVFISFTLSQLGMVRLWSKVAKLQPGEQVQTTVTTLRYEPHWRWKRIPSLAGGIVTGLVLVILAVTKFTEGAWIVLVALLLMIVLFRTIKQHYEHVASNLSLQGLAPENLRNPADVVIVPISGVHRASLRAIKYALKFSRDVRVVKVVADAADEAETRRRWERWGEITDSAQLIFLHTDYRNFLQPLVNYIRCVNHTEFPGQLVTVVVPEFVPDSRIAHLLHNQSAALLRVRLRGEEDIVVIDMPYHLRKQPPALESADQARSVPDQ